MDGCAYLAEAFWCQYGVGQPPGAAQQGEATVHGLEQLSHLDHLGDCISCNANRLAQLQSPFEAFFPRRKESFLFSVSDDFHSHRREA